MMSPFRSLSRSAALAALLLGALALRAEPAPDPALALPRFTHPGAGQTVYFLMTDRFANGRTDNDTGGISGGPDQTGFDPSRISHYHGGDFAGLTAHLDYLKRLGVTAVWVTPPFKNKAMQDGTAGYHGYWITDFLQIDPHLGTNAEFEEFVRQAHVRGLRVYMDIIANHTADVIQYVGGDTRYRSLAEAPYRDASGKVFDARKVAYNGVNNPADFPTLSAEKSFAYVPTIPAAEATIKNPAWLNDVTLYHNRGNSTFYGESATEGDFVGLDDLFTEHPRVVQGMIGVYGSWLKTGIDGFRIDTVRHVNNEFWQAFAPAIREQARALNRPDFIQFAEVANGEGDMTLLSEFSTEVPLDATLDFGFFAAARRFVSAHGSARALSDFFAKDDYYIDHDSNIHSSTTFLGNHDNGRFAYFLQQDNPGASPELLARLSELGHGLLLLSRGQPVLYYGDEQGMIGRGGNDMQAREDMFPSKAPDFASASLLGTQRKGTDDKFDESHPFYRHIAALNHLRAENKALRTGAMLPHDAGSDDLFAFSRVDREERVELLVLMNASRTQRQSAKVATLQAPGATMELVYDSLSPEKAPHRSALIDSEGRLASDLAPLQFTVWKARTPLGKGSPLAVSLSNPTAGAALHISSREVDGLRFPTRQEIRAEVSGGDGFAEVSFLMERSSRPGQYSWLGTDDTPPYRVFWRPPADLLPGETLRFVVTASDLRGHLASAELGRITVDPASVPCGIQGSKTPELSPITRQVSADGKATRLHVSATGTAPLDYAWLHNGTPITGQTGPELQLPATPTREDRYEVLVHNRAGTTVEVAP